MEKNLKPISEVLGNYSEEDIVGYLLEKYGADSVRKEVNGDTMSGNVQTVLSNMSASELIDYIEAEHGLNAIVDNVDLGEFLSMCNDSDVLDYFSASDAVDFFDHDDLLEKIDNDDIVGYLQDNRVDITDCVDPYDIVERFFDADSLLCMACQKMHIPSKYLTNEDIKNDIKEYLDNYF